MLVVLVVLVPTASTTSARILRSQSRFIVRTHLTGYERCVPARLARKVSSKGANE